MKISMLVAACNAGPMLKDTLISIEEGCDGSEYEVIVVDDQSEDGACDNLPPPVKLIKPPLRLGCSGSRHLAGQHATGDVLITCDPHCLFPKGSLVGLANTALNSHGPVQPPVHLEGWRMLKGSFLKLTDKGLRTQTIGRVTHNPMLFGSIYAFNREVWNRIGQYDPLPGWWNYDEPYYSCIAYRLGMRIQTVNVPTCTHRKYRGIGKLPYYIPPDHESKNAHWFHAVCFPGNYWSRFCKMLNDNLPPPIDQVWVHGNQQLQRIRSYVTDNAVKSEDWVLKNVVV